ncbi:hypothetical protein AGLY_008351 [Aphis glycines]|uniref:Uncharacterized protein n=1 Tax=Aphis glycines TaxID=307491 RepID=A0A6G0TLN2_APHGL|nr:hypothetical protein AGLY_008351 [Aphis glycines]
MLIFPYDVTSVWHDNNLIRIVFLNGVRQNLLKQFNHRCIIQSLIKAKLKLLYTDLQCYTLVRQKHEVRCNFIIMQFSDSVPRHYSMLFPNGYGQSHNGKYYIHDLKHYDAILVIKILPKRFENIDGFTTNYVNQTFGKDSLSCPNGCGRSYTGANRKNNLKHHLNYACGINPQFYCKFCVKYLNLLKNIEFFFQMVVIDLWSKRRLNINNLQKISLTKIKYNNQFFEKYQNRNEVDLLSCPNGCLLSYK